MYYPTNSSRILCMKKKVSIVLPVYNEKDVLKSFVTSVVRVAKKLPKYKIYIIISDSHSNDGTKTIANELAKKYRNVFYTDNGPGIGEGIYNGHMYARKLVQPDIYLQLDADGQVDNKIIPDLIKTIESGYGFAFGSRFVAGGKNNLPFIRKMFTNCSSIFCRLFIGPWNIKEFTNSARAFNKQTFNKINWKSLPLGSKTFIFLPALVHASVATGVSYKEIPLVFNSRLAGYSKNKIIRYIFALVQYAVSLHIKSLR